MTVLDKDLLSSIAQRMLSGTTVELNGKRTPVRRTSAHRFRTVAFENEGREYQAIEQNPEKPDNGRNMVSHSGTTSPEHRYHLKS